MTEQTIVTTDTPVALKRPPVLTILTVLLFLRAFLLLTLSGLVLYGIWLQPDISTLTALAESALDIVVIAVSILLLVSAYGLWKLRPWAWRLNLLLMGFALVFGLWTQYNHRRELLNTLTMLLNIIIVFYLVMPDVRALFISKKQEIPTL